MDAADLFGAELSSAIRAHAVARGTPDQRVAASVLFQGYVRRVAEPLVDALVHGQPLPDPGLDVVVVQLVDGWIDDVRLGATTCPTDDGVGDGRWSWAQRRLVVDNISPAVEAVRGEVRLGARTIWGNAVSAIASAFRVAATDHPDPAAVADRLAWFLARDRRTDGLCTIAVLDHAARSWLVHERHTCCLVHKIPDHTHCATCSLLDPAERRARTVDALPVVVRVT